MYDRRRYKGLHDPLSEIYWFISVKKNDYLCLKKEHYMSK